LQDFEIKFCIFCGTCNETGEEVVRAIQSTGVRADVATSLENQVHGRRIRAQALCRSIDQDSQLSALSIDRPRYSIKRIVDRATKIVNRATIKVDVACSNFNVLTTADNPIRVFFGVK